MEFQRFNIRSRIFFEDIITLIEKKGSEYQSDDDVLSNFKSNAEELGITPYQVWSVYFTKHTKSIINQIKKNPNNPNQTDSVENTKSRITDAIAYLLFLKTMIDETENK